MEKPKKTLSDEEVRERDDLLKVLQDPNITVKTVSGDPPKISVTKVAWGVVIWMVMLLALLLLGGFGIMALWNNIALDVGLSPISYTAGVNAAGLVMLLGRLATAMRLDK